MGGLRDAENVSLHGVIGFLGVLDWVTGKIEMKIELLNNRRVDAMLMQNPIHRV